MSWLTVDDVAPENAKQLAAGASACWLWLCGLAYCERQERKDGFIPEAKVKLLYPGLGLKEANRLVQVGLWHKVDGGYQVHQYSEWRAKRFGDFQSDLGRRGGAVKSEAKSLAASEREHRKRIAQEAQPVVLTEAQAACGTSTTTGYGTEPQAFRSDPIRSDPIQPTTSIGDLEDPGRETVCPLNLLEKLENNGTIARLAEQMPAPIDAVRACVRAFVATWTIGKLAGQRRAGWPGKARQWVIDQHAQGKLVVSPNGSKGTVAPSPYLAEAIAAGIGTGRGDLF